MKRLLGKLDNLMDDNIYIYDEVSDNLYEIDDLIFYIIHIDDFASEYNDLINSLENCEYYFMNIKNIISQAKDNGIQNEDSLYKGKDIINDLENELEELLENLSNSDNNYNSLINQIENIKNEIDDLKNQNLASKHRLRKIEGARYQFICNAHDAIFGYADSSEWICYNAKEELKRTISPNEDQSEEIYNKLKNYFLDITDSIQSDIYSINDALDQARHMNDRMGQGIYDKIDRIEELEQEIENINDSLYEKENSNSDLSEELKELESILEELKSTFD